MEITGTQKSDASKAEYLRPRYVWTVDYLSTWDEIMERVGPTLMDEASEQELRHLLNEYGIELSLDQRDRMPNAIATVSERKIPKATVDDVLVQLFALGLIDHGSKKRTMSDRNKYWVLTAAGQDQVMRLRALRKPTRAELRAQRVAELRAMTVPTLRTHARDQLGLAGGGNKEALVEAIVSAELP
jgi:hypothetical protein